MKNIIVLLMMGLVMFGCGEDFLEKKPNKSIVVPSTLDDLQALLNNTGVMNTTPAIGILGADDYFTTASGWAEWTNPIERNGYVWSSDVYQGQQSCGDWTSPYQQVFYANVVLDALKEIGTTPANDAQWKAVKGRALFHRGFAFYQLAQVFCLPYQEETRSAPGIPLRLSSEVNAPVSRATLGETYDQILRDLTDANALLSANVLSPAEPSRAASSAALAIVYLAMANYDKAEELSSKALEINGTLLDYNELDEASIRPVPTLSDEILFHASVISYRFISSTLTYVDTVLFDTYSDDDLRKSILFRRRADKRYTFKGNYTGSSSLFGGISNNEVFLIRAECRVRNGNIPGALEDLNALLVKRWRAGTFTPVAENDAEVLLKTILSERQKELVFRPSRWTDLRRLNSDARFQKTLSRELEGVVYTLPPNDPRYVYPIPPQEINLSGIEQNLRP